MCQIKWPLPEGFDQTDFTPQLLQQAMVNRTILSGYVLRSDPQRNLILQLGSYTGFIPRAECVAPFLSGSTRDIAVLSCVGRTVSFLVTGITKDGRYLLSRRQAQEQAMDTMISLWHTGLVIPAQITHLAPFGAFVDVGCGIISLIPLSAISVSHILHPSERFQPHQRVYVRLDHIDLTEKRIYLTHRELLGTWQENASLFQVDETVPGIVRTQTDYGIFVELTPNLTGLADLTPQSIDDGCSVAVLIRAIQPQQRKIKLQIIQRLDAPIFPTPLRYWISSGQITDWNY